MSFLIEINERQRAFLEAACLAALRAGFPEDRNDIDLEFLPEMFGGLPKEEADAPGVIHGFAL